MFRRLMNLIRGFFGLFVSGLERRNPEALLEVEKENLRKTIVQYNNGLASHAGLAERLMGQVRKLQAEQTDLRAKTAAHLKIGNRQAAAQYALRLQTVERELTENQAQAAQAEQTYKELLAARDTSINAAKAKIDALRRDLDDLKVKKAMADLTEMASGMVTQIGGAGDTLDRLHKMVEEDKQKASGRLRLAQDTLSMSDIKLKEAEQAALADQALADFAAREGIDMPGDSTPAAPTPDSLKSMGQGQDPLRN